MPRTSSRRRNRKVVEEEDNDLEFLSPRSKSHRSSLISSMSQEHDEGDSLTFTQQCSPDFSQQFPVAKANERSNLEKLSEDERHKIIVDASRIVLFKALAGEPIERLKCVNEAIGKVTSKPRIITAVWEEVKANLSNVFGIELVKPPHFMEKYLPNKYKDRYFCINNIEDETGAHSKAIHSIHNDSAMGKGLLMVVLALIFCKGSLKPNYGPMRWISDVDLYRLLHGLDDRMPQDPPPEKKGVSSFQTITTINGESPNIDALLFNFCHQDYLWKIKEDGEGEEQPVTLYAMGPRAALEVGRRQIIYFCSEILEEQPDPTMLQELENEGPTQAPIQATTQ